MTKVCTGCAEEKPLEAYARQAAGKHGRTARCRACNAARLRQYYQENKERHAADYLERRR